MSSATTSVDDSFVPGTDAFARRLRRAQGCVRTLLLGLGEDPEREGLRDTPKVRIVRIGYARVALDQSGARPVVRRGQTTTARSRTSSTDPESSPTRQLTPSRHLPRTIQHSQRVAKAFLDMTQGYRQDRVR